MLRTDSVIAQFMYWATFCPVHEMGKAVAQFMKWAGLCPFHEMGRCISAHFMNCASNSLVKSLNRWKRKKPRPLGLSIKPLRNIIHNHLLVDLL